MAALDFPASPSLNQLHVGPGGIRWRWDGTKWVAYGTASSGGGIDDAPADGVSYGRKDVAWVPVLALSGDVLDGGNF